MKISIIMLENQRAHTYLLLTVYPSAGSVYHWAGQIGPPNSAVITAYTCGWFNMLGNVAGDAAFAAGFANILSKAIEYTLY